jgi:hypothetical protein
MMSNSKETPNTTKYNVLPQKTDNGLVNSQVISNGPNISKIGKKNQSKITSVAATELKNGNVSKNFDEIETEKDNENEIKKPFPWLAMTSLCAGMLAHSVVFTNPLPYVAFMVVDFNMADSLDTAGYYAGWITGTFMIGVGYYMYYNLL